MHLLYDYWRSLPLRPIHENAPLQPRFVRGYSPRDFFRLPEVERRQSFWNSYACGLAGNAHITPDGNLWRSETELLDCALQQLERLAFIGITEDMEGSMDALSRRLDVPNRYSGQFHNVTMASDEVDPDLFATAGNVRNGRRMPSSHHGGKRT